MNASQRVALRARLVLPVATAPLDGGIVTLAGDRIVSVGENTSGAAPRDLGDVALLPGLINPHTHLEFSLLAKPLGTAGMPLSDWIQEVVRRRRADADVPDAALNLARRGEAIRAGWQESLQGGVTTLADIATWDLPDTLLEQYRGTGVLFRELIGLGGARLAEQHQHARRHMSRAECPSRANWTFALSPHAPYTAALELIHQTVDLSRRQRVPVALHLAESPEELELLATGSGPFRELLERFEVWNPVAFPGGRAPADYLQVLSRAPRGLVIHGNYLHGNDWQYLADHRDTLSVVYCPRTHDYFQHPRYPLSRMLDRGVRVVLGTDGRASTCNLRLFEELQFAAARHGDVAPRQLLRMVTIEAAIALGCESDVGSLAAGKRADLIAVPLPRSPRSSDDPYATLLDAGQRISAVWCGGIPVQVPEEQSTFAPRR